MIRKIARPMLASVFILDGVDALRKTNERVDTTEDLIKRVRKIVPADIADAIPDSPKTVARILGGTKVGAGSLFAIGKAPRFAAATLAVTTLPTLISRDAFWAADEDGERRARLNNFATSSALLGGLFIASQDTEGKPGLKWRAEHASKQAGKKMQQALPTKSDSEKMWDEAREKAGDFTDQAGDWIKDSSEKAQAYVNDNKGDWSKTANEWLDAARSNAKTAKKSTVKAAQKAQDKANDALKDAEKKHGKKAKKARKNAEKIQSKADKALSKAMKKLDKKIDF